MKLWWHRPTGRWRAWVLLSLPWLGAAHGATLTGIDLALTVEPGGCGLVDKLTYQGADLLAAPAGFVGAGLTLAPAGDGSLDSLFGHRAAGELPARLTSVTAEGGRLVAIGAYTDGQISVPFRRTITAAPDDPLLIVEEETDYTALPLDRLVARHRLALPLVLPADAHERLLGLGGQTRAELFRMDQNDVRRTNQNLSDNRAYWPYWDLGGLIQRPGGYSLWKANHADTLALPLEEGQQSAGWADFSSLRSGLTLRRLDADRAAPYALTIDARAGWLALDLWPAAEPPIAGAALGRRMVRYALLPHETSWPVPYRCELPRERYLAMLRWLDEKAPGQQDSHLSFYAAARLGTGDIATIMDKERIQPSTVLRTFYHADAWRMGGLAKTILGIDVPRNQSQAAWEQVAQKMLDAIAKNGVPRH
ncbi:MAG: hypothetical protein HZB16_08540 [Armatimonadetes bacterium]|nr:hypothetical protein [Armatimonadota bacterium]